MNIEKLVSTIHKSIHRANKDHSEWTGGWWLQAYGVEGFLVSRIADGIMRLPKNERPGYLTFETSFSELYDSQGRRPSGKRSKYSKDSNRIDIALYHKNECVSHVIEVKRTYSTACRDDIKRLCSFYKKYSSRVGKGSLKEALFVQAVWVTVESEKIDKELEDYFDTLESLYSQTAQKENLNCELFRGTAHCQKMILKNSPQPGKTQMFSSLCLRIRP